MCLNEAPQDPQKAAGSCGVSAQPGYSGPEDVTPPWDAVRRRTHEDNVRRLRQRIFKATQGPRVESRTKGGIMASIQ